MTVLTFLLGLVSLFLFFGLRFLVCHVDRLAHFKEPIVFQLFIKRRRNRHRLGLAVIERQTGNLIDFAVILGSVVGD